MPDSMVSLSAKRVLCARDFSRAWIRLLLELSARPATMQKSAQALGIQARLDIWGHRGVRPAPRQNRRVANIERSPVQHAQAPRIVLRTSVAWPATNHQYEFQRPSKIFFRSLTNSSRETPAAGVENYAERAGACCRMTSRKMAPYWRSLVSPTPCTAAISIAFLGLRWAISISVRSANTT